MVIKQDADIRAKIEALMKEFTIANEARRREIANELVALFDLLVKPS